MWDEMSRKKEQLTTGMLLDMGVPAHLKGYRYVRTAVIMAEEDMSYNTTDGKVDRAIRNAIEVSWERGNRDTFEKLFGYCAENGTGRPTNSEYIAAVADAVRIQMNQ